MSTFTAVLGTPQCRPGNILLATVYSGAGPIMASAAILGVSAVVALGVGHLNAASEVVGSANLAPTGKADHSAISDLTGLAVVTAAPKDEDSPSCVVSATSHFFINPAKVSVIFSAVFAATSVPSKYHPSPQLRLYQPGTPTRSTSLITTPAVNSTPKKTQRGGLF